MSEAEGVVILAGAGKRHASTPGRFFDLKLLGQETAGSIMIFEETVPPGTGPSHYHLHRDSDEIAWVLAGEITFKIGDAVTTGGPGTCAFIPRTVAHAWKNTGDETGRVLFLYTPAAAGGYFEAMAEGPARPMTTTERDELCARYRWEILGPNPL